MNRKQQLQDNIKFYKERMKEFEATLNQVTSDSDKTFWRIGLKGLEGKLWNAEQELKG